MLKFILALYLVLGLTACRERRGPEPHSSQTMIETVYVQKTVTEALSEEPLPKIEVPLVEIPILEETLPTLPTPLAPIEPVVSAPSYGSIQTFTGGSIADGLNIKNIRSSQSTERTRLVFDTYKDADNSATQSGQYTFTYYPKQKRISAVLHGYKHFSALENKKERFFSTSRFIEKLNIKKYKDNSGYKLNIMLMEDASVNVFELKNPARIIVDVTPK